ncbi:hypothetical protein MKX01_019835 [Papaver californicum]|nr:hypothetical protein MKX01_019835 [Papaver californicum]
MELCSSSIIPSPRVPLKKGPWSETEDLLLTRYIEEYGPRNWAQVRLGAREFEPDEVDLISRMHKLLGNRQILKVCHCSNFILFFNVNLFSLFRWTLIAGRIPGRTANDIMNYCNTYLLKKKSDKLPRPNVSKAENSHMMETTKVVRPVPRMISKSPIILTRSHQKLTQIIDNNNGNNSSALLSGLENSTTSFHVDNRLKLQNKNGSIDDYFCNFDADQGVEECSKVGDKGNCLYNDLYFGDDLWSMI